MLCQDISKREFFVAEIWEVFLLVSIISVFILISLNLIKPCILIWIWKLHKYYSNWSNKKYIHM